jgi:hypothetical protein
MPEPADPLDKAVDVFNQRFPDIHCPVCGHTDFGLTELAMAPLGRGRAIPMLPAICSKCGHILFFSAIALGLVPRPAPPQPSAEGTAGEAHASDRTSPTS